MKRRILARSEYWRDERRMSEATAGLRFVRESVAPSTLNIAQDLEGEECAIDQEDAYRCPSGEPIYGAWRETGGECANGRLYNGVALGLAALAGAMTGAGWYRFLPLDWNSLGPDNEDMGVHGFDEVRIDGLKGCDASMAADYARDGKCLFRLTPMPPYGAAPTTTGATLSRLRTSQSAPRTTRRKFWRSTGRGRRRKSFRGRT